MFGPLKQLKLNENGNSASFHLTKIKTFLVRAIFNSVNRNELN